LIRRLGNFPLALSQAAAYMVEFITLAPHVISACSYIKSGEDWVLKFDTLRDQKKLANDDERFKYLLMSTSASLEKLLDMQRGAYAKLLGKRMLLNKDDARDRGDSPESLWCLGGFEWEVLRERDYRGKRQALVVARECVEQRAYDQVSFEEWKSAAYHGVDWEHCSLRAYLNNLPTERRVLRDRASRTVFGAGDRAKESLCAKRIFAALFAGGTAADFYAHRRRGQADREPENAL
jgi:hypothetical protein